MQYHRGLVNAFGAFQTYYEVGPLRAYSPSTIAWIGSAQSFLMLLFGALTGPLFDAGHFRTLLTTGSLLIVLGMMMTSMSHSYWQIMLSQAICMGLGMGCLFVPSLAIITTYFSEKRFFLAMGLAASGSGLGGTIYPIIFHQLQPTLGFARATRVTAAIVLITLAISNAVMRIRELPSSRRKIFDTTAWTEPTFVVYVMGSTIVFLGTWTPFFYVEIYALSYAITAPHLAFYLLSVITTGSIFGRIIPNVVAARLGMFNVVIPCILTTGILGFCFIPAKTQGSLVAVSLLYGFFSGSCVSIIPALGVMITRDREVVGTRIGMACAAIGLGMLGGTPIAGAILARHGFAAMWAFCGSAAVVGALLLCVARGLHGGWTLLQRV